MARPSLYRCNNISNLTAYFCVVSSILRCLRRQNNRLKEIAISIRPTEDVIKHADFLAQADQQGSGLSGAHRMSSNSPAPMPVMLQQEKLS